MLSRLFISKKNLQLALCAVLASTFIPAGLCLFSLAQIRAEIAEIEHSVVDAHRARDLVDKVGQGLFNFTAAALDLSEEERQTVFAQTDDHLKALGGSVANAQRLTRKFLSADEQEKLNEAIGSIAHSWEEVRERVAVGISAPEKAFHFLKIFDDAQIARAFLVKLEGAVSRSADEATVSALNHANEITVNLLLVIMIGACVSTAALITNHRSAQKTHRANEHLTKAISDLQERDQALEMQNERFDAALGNMPHGLCMFDSEKRLILCNVSYEELYGLPVHLTRPGTPLWEILSFRASVGNAPRDADTYINQHAALAAKGHTTQFECELEDGRTIRVSHKPMENGGYVASHEDITAKISAEAQIAHMAHHDALTSLPNRVLFHEEMSRALARTDRGEKVAVLCLDLDHFKTVNDTLGHPIGDALLKVVAARLQGCVRDMDAVARLGGDEFAIVQVGVEGPDQTIGLAQRVIDALSAPYDLDGHQVVIGASVGIAFAPDDNDNPDHLLKSADMALYRAKADGRGTFRFFESEMDARMQIRRALELDLRKALPSGEFEVHYQPLVNLAENQVTGFEALLRWTHPERGCVSPTDFIPLAEEIGLIGQIGAWVLRQACTDAAKWPSSVRLAVNLSPAQFKSKTLVLDVIAALSHSGLPAQRLELEITETVMLQDTETTLAILHQLRELGVRISMDDFGTGYSSLSYLRKFPFDKIKIDQSFIRDLPDGQDAVAIIKAVAGLGKGLGMSTTAEGVENEGQLEKLRAEGCTEVQGWFFSEARPASEVVELLSSISQLCKAAA